MSTHTICFPGELLDITLTWNSIIPVIKSISWRLVIFQAAYEKRVLITRDTSKSSGEPAHKRSLFRAFVVHAVGTSRKPVKNVCSLYSGLRMRIWSTTNRKTIRSVFRVPAHLVSTFLFKDNDWRVYTLTFYECRMRFRLILRTLTWQKECIFQTLKLFIDFLVLWLLRKFLVVWICFFIN